MGTNKRNIVLPDETTLLENNFKIKCDDGFSLAATTFHDKKLTVRNAVVLASALGVPRYIYFKLARYLARSGVAILTFDYRGIYESQRHSYSGSDIRVKDWGRYDVNAALRWTQNNWQPEKLYYLGHSCGGQILGLAPQSTEIDRAVFIASQSGYWKLWPALQRWGLWFIWHVFPLLSPWIENFPAQTLGLSSVDIPSGVAREWARWGKAPNYLWDFISEEESSRYHNLTFPFFQSVLRMIIILVPLNL